MAAPMSLSSVTIYQTSLVSSGQSSWSLLIITIVISMLSPALWPAPPAWGLVSGVWGGTGRPGHCSGAGAGAAWQERRGAPVVCGHRPSADLWSSGHHGSSVTSEITSWVVTYSKKPGPLTNIAQVPTPGRSETGSPITGAAFISSAPAWHTPPTQVSLGHQWNYLNVQHRENILSAGKKWIWLDYSWGLERRPCSLSPSDCYGENFKSARMPLVTLQLLTSLSPKSISTTYEKRA